MKPIGVLLQLHPAPINAKKVIPSVTISQRNSNQLEGKFAYYFPNSDLTVLK
jgi:hypothetical protein